MMHLKCLLFSTAPSSIIKLSTAVAARTRLVKTAQRLSNVTCIAVLILVSITLNCFIWICLVPIAKQQFVINNFWNVTTLSENERSGPGLSDSHLKKELDICEAYTPSGLQAITFHKPELEEIIRDLPDISPGGIWKPQNCRANYSQIDIIVPYRDRENHLRIFLNYIHRFLQKQKVPYRIFIIEQSPKSQFNRGVLLNVGFLESQKQRKRNKPGLKHYHSKRLTTKHPNEGSKKRYVNRQTSRSNCVIFHDVDLLPEDDRNIYQCQEGEVRHLSAHVDEFAYRLPYTGLVGGAVAFDRHDFHTINGFSNRFFGWGGEDDDLFNRIKYHGLNITRYHKDISRYKMLRHRKIYPNKDRFKHLQTGDRRFLTDGLNNLKYIRRRYQLKPLYTWVYVDIMEPEYVIGQ